MIRQLALLVGAAAAAVLLLAGGYTLATGRAVAELWNPPPPEFRMHFDAERTAAIARLPGDYRVHADPRVSYVLKPEARLEIAGAPVDSDLAGMRRRASAEPGDPQRIVLLGDSIVFGYGVLEHEGF